MSVLTNVALGCAVGFVFLIAGSGRERMIPVAVAVTVVISTYLVRTNHVAPGCFRCHDGNHTSADGQTITNDCSACHELIPADGENIKILKELEMK